MQILNNLFYKLQAFFFFFNNITKILNQSSLPILMQN